MTYEARECAAAWALGARARVGRSSRRTDTHSPVSVPSCALTRNRSQKLSDRELWERCPFHRESLPHVRTQSVSGLAHVTWGACPDYTSRRGQLQTRREAARLACIHPRLAARQLHRTISPHGAHPGGHSDPCRSGGAEEWSPAPDATSRARDVLAQPCDSDPWRRFLHLRPQPRSGGGFGLATRA